MQIDTEGIAEQSDKFFEDRVPEDSKADFKEYLKKYDQSITGYYLTKLFLTKIFSTGRDSSDTVVKYITNPAIAELIQRGKPLTPTQLYEAHTDDVIASDELRLHADFGQETVINLIKETKQQLCKKAYELASGKKSTVEIEDCSLLHLRNGQQDFIHDTYRDFFLAKYYVESELPNKPNWEDSHFLETMVFYSGFVGDSTKVVEQIRQANIGFEQKYGVISRCAEQSEVELSTLKDIGGDIISELRKPEHSKLAEKPFWQFCMDCFIRIGIENTVDDLFEAWEGGISYKYRRAAGFILNQLRSDRTLKTFVEYLCDAELEGYNEVKDYLRNWWKDEPDKVFEAMRAPFLIENLYDREMAFSGDWCYFLQAMGYIGEPRLRPYLVEESQGPDSFQKDWALDALNKLDKTLTARAKTQGPS